MNGALHAAHDHHHRLSVSQTGTEPVAFVQRTDYLSALKKYRLDSAVTSFKFAYGERDLVSKTANQPELKQYAEEIFALGKEYGRRYGDL